MIEKPNEKTTIGTYDKTGIFHLLIVYLVWGSTYLAIRIAVRDGSGFPPFMMGAMRVLAAGFVLLLIGMFNKNRLKITLKEFLILFGSGILLWTGGNGLVMFGEQKADSAVAALIIASTPIWVAVIEAVIDRKIPSLMLIVSLLVGLAGMITLSIPLILSGFHAEILSVIALALGAMSWSLGTILQTRNRLELSPAVSSGYQSVFGGIGFIFLIILLKEPIPHPIAQAWFAWGYLVVFGSIIAFTSFIQALRRLPVKIVTTYSYVNPMIAVVLGWIILGEQITQWTIIGALLILLGVAGVFRSHAAIGH
jgi:drug/metabolite transporter (DMT)-like permease